MADLAKDLFPEPRRLRFLPDSDTEDGWEMMVSVRISWHVMSCFILMRISEGLSFVLLRKSVPLHRPRKHHQMLLVMIPSHSLAIPVLCKRTHVSHVFMIFWLQLFFLLLHLFTVVGHYEDRGGIAWPSSSISSACSRQYSFACTIFCSSAAHIHIRLASAFGSVLFQELV